MRYHCSSQALYQQENITYALVSDSEEKETDEMSDKDSIRRVIVRQFKQRRLFGLAGTTPTKMLISLQRVPTLNSLLYLLTSASCGAMGETQKAGVEAQVQISLPLTCEI